MYTNLNVQAENHKCRADANNAMHYTAKKGEEEIAYKKSNTQILIYQLLG
jgi:hypothetical protein